jgi:hypothetical protein
MQRIGEETISSNERDFIQKVLDDMDAGLACAGVLGCRFLTAPHGPQAIRDDLRSDGRGPYTHRDILIEVRQEYS